MKKAINLYFTNGDTKEKLDNIKKTGFDGVVLGVWDKSENMKLDEQVEYCKKIGLGISMIHCAYDENTNNLWSNSKEGDKFERDIIEQIKSIKDYNNRYFVIHTNNSPAVEYTKFGLERINRILQYCEKYNIVLCIENLNVSNTVDYIFKNIKSEYIALCYDSGHENCFTPNADYLLRYSNLLKTVHIHDNDGTADQHKILGEGTIDIDYLASRLSKCNFEYLSTEIKHFDNNTSQLAVLTKALESLKNLEKNCKQNLENSVLVKNKFVNLK